MNRPNMLLHPDPPAGGVGTLNDDEAAVVKMMREKKVGGRDLIAHANRGFAAAQADKGTAGGKDGGGTPGTVDVKSEVKGAIREYHQQEAQARESARTLEIINDCITKSLEDFPALSEDEDEREILDKAFIRNAKESGKDYKSMNDREFKKFVQEIAQKTVADRAKKRGVASKSETDSKVESRSKAMSDTGETGSGGRTGGQSSKKPTRDADDDGEMVNRPGRPMRYGIGTKWPTDHELEQEMQAKADEFLKKARKTG